MEMASICMMAMKKHHSHCVPLGALAIPVRSTHESRWKPFGYSSASRASSTSERVALMPIVSSCAIRNWKQPFQWLQEHRKQKQTTRTSNGRSTHREAHSSRVSGWAGEESVH